ncbi:MAG: ribbon-helix-helix protein, CopG family, partial [Kiritimatiellae bacterium]|nr:ribbon-helix-helix protein, CopG family [Kiritimatiellia bacterium]
MDGKKTAGGGVERVTVTLPREVVEALDAEVAAGGGRNRSALASELLRCAQQHRAGRTGEAMAAGSVSAVYDAGTRGVLEGLAAAEGEAPGAGVEVVASVETGLDGGKRLRVALAKGKAGAV